MGRNKVELTPTTFMIYGFDAPCGGYFANYFDTEDEDYKESGNPTDEIGFFPGVSKGKILDFFEKHDAIQQVKEQTAGAYDLLCMDLPC